MGSASSVRAIVSRNFLPASALRMFWSGALMMSCVVREDDLVLGRLVELVETWGLVTGDPVLVERPVWVMATGRVYVTQILARC